MDVTSGFSATVSAEEVPQITTKTLTRKKQTTAAEEEEEEEQNIISCNSKNFCVGCLMVLDEKIESKAKSINPTIKVC